MLVPCGPIGPPAPVNSGLMPQRFLPSTNMAFKTSSAFERPPREVGLAHGFARLGPAAPAAFHRSIVGLGLSVWRGLYPCTSRGALPSLTGAAACGSPSPNVQNCFYVSFTAKASFNLAGITGRSRGRLYLPNICHSQMGAP
jgi:hypothetical protein